MDCCGGTKTMLLAANAGRGQSFCLHRIRNGAIAVSQAARLDFVSLDGGIGAFLNLSLSLLLFEVYKSICCHKSIGVYVEFDLWPDLFGNFRTTITKRVELFTSRSRQAWRDKSKSQSSGASSECFSCVCLCLEIQTITNEPRMLWFLLFF